MTRAVVLVAVVAAVLGAAERNGVAREEARCKAGEVPTPTRCVRDASWAELLARPVRVPTIASGAPCPTSRRDPRGDLKKLTGWGRGVPAWGPGPAYPFLRSSRDRAVLVFGYRGPYAATPWGAAKAIWFLARTYSGRVLVRGRQLDGPNELRFENGRPAFTDEQLRNPATTMRVTVHGGHPSVTRVREPGCYAYQIDGRTFSRLIVFEAVREE